jgi:glycosyltransferase involved in cell wall biosynthesis
MPSLSVFGEYMCYRMGGAEKSTHLLLGRLSQNTQVEITPVSGVCELYDRTFERIRYDGLVELPVVRLRYRLPFLQYGLNTRTVSSYFRSCAADLLFANGQSAPMAVNAFKGPSVYFIHDEMSLNIYRTYETTALKRLKFAARWLLDLPFMLHYRRENVRAMLRAKLVVANSRYVARRAKELLGVDATVIYPQIDVSGLSATALPLLEERPYIMMVGDQDVKGADTFRMIAEAMPGEKFLAIGRGFADGTYGNVTRRGFVSDPLTYYRRSKLVLLPSTWEEGFGMVSVEASALGIPTIVSDRGGLPETVPSSDMVVADYRYPARWVGAIERTLDDYERRSEAARDHARQFDGRLQAAALVERVRDATGVDLD